MPGLGAGGECPGPEARSAHKHARPGMDAAALRSRRLGAHHRTRRREPHLRALPAARKGWRRQDQDPLPAQPSPEEGGLGSYYFPGNGLGARGREVGAAADPLFLCSLE